jgi:hypothetical protein
MYLFCSIPNYSGSTLIHNLIAPSAVTLRKSAEVTMDFVEGNMISPRAYLYKNVSQLYTEDAKLKLQNKINYNWQQIKKSWEDQWSCTTTSDVYLQKTPHDIFRVKMMSEQFENLKWIICVKDPYAYVESLFRKYQKLKITNPYKELDKICNHVLLVLKTQSENIEILGTTAYTTTLEDFIERKQYHADQIEQFTNGLVKIDFSKQIWIKGQTSGEIINTNVE